MSVKRRQEAIARFSVPLEGISSLETTGCSAPRRPSRKPRNATFVAESASSDGSDWDDNDSDFVMRDDPETEPNGGSSLNRKKTKGKGKAVMGNSSDFDPSHENPRVMLLSLKAVS